MTFLSDFKLIYNLDFFILIYLQNLFENCFKTKNNISKTHSSNFSNNVKWLYDLDSLYIHENLLKTKYITFKTNSNGFKWF